MSWFPRPASPLAAIADLRSFLRQRSREQVIAGSLAFLITSIVIVMFLVDSKINTAPPPTIIYTDSWSIDRSDAEIIAQQKKDQAAQQAAAEERQKQYQALENRFGL